MRLSIYRATTHLTYPDESMMYSYAFQPITGEELTRDGRLMGWTDPGLEPYAVIEIPDGSQVIHDEEGWQLVVPDRPFGIDAEVVYELALDHSFGLLVIGDTTD